MGLKPRIFQNSMKHEILVILLSFLAVMWLQVPRLFDPYMAEEDLRYFYQFNNFQQPELFTINYLRPVLHLGYINIFGEKILLFYDSIAYGLIFYLASYVFTPVTFSKILPFILLPITTLYVLKFGQHVGDRKQGLIFAIGFIVLNLISPSSLSINSAIPRSFSLPLIIVFIYYFECKRYFASALSVALSATLYPPMCLIQMLTWFLKIFTTDRISKKQIWINLLSLKYLVLSGFLCVLVLSPVLAQALFAPESERKLSESLGSFIQGGRYQLFDMYPLVGNGGLVSSMFDLRHFSAITVIGIFIYIFLRDKSFNVPRLINLMFLSSIILFIAAWLIALTTDSFLLYLPSRYPRVGIYLFLLAYLCFNLISFVRVAPKVIYQNRKIRLLIELGVMLGIIFLLLSPVIQVNITIITKILLIILLFLVLGIFGHDVLKINKVLLSHQFELKKINHTLLGLLIVIMAIPFLGYTKFISNTSFLNPSRPHREFLDYIKTLPPDVLIAGSPCLLDNIPLFSNRQILFSCELDTDKGEIITQALDAYYAEDFNPLSNLCKDYKIDYIAVNELTYSEEYLKNGWIFFEPYNENIYPIVSQRDVYVLTQVPDKAKTFISEPIYVVSCKWIVDKD